MTDEVNLLQLAVLVKLAPIRDERLMIGPAEAFVVEFRGVSNAVIDRHAHELSVKLAGSVPCAVERADRGGVAVIALVLEVMHQVARGGAPIGHDAVDVLGAAPAVKAVDKDEGLLVFRLPFGVGGACRNEAGGADKADCEDDADDSA